MAVSDDALDLLLSLQDERVVETPPHSPSSAPRIGEDGYTDPRNERTADMSVFRDVVKEYLFDSETAAATSTAAGVRGGGCTGTKVHRSKKSGEVLLEKFSGLRIRNSLMSPTEINNRFSDIRFVGLPAIKNLLSNDRLNGCWATVGILQEKGEPRVSSSGKSYSIWKIGCLNEFDVSVFLFGDAHTDYKKESVGTVFALFNCAVRMDTGGKGFSLSVYSAGQMAKMGISADYGVCKSMRKDGMPCTMPINKCQGAYCKFHQSKSSEKYTTSRAELKGGNLRTAFRRQSEGIFMIDHSTEFSATRKPLQPVKVMSVNGLKRALSNADMVTPNKQSQGIRFLAHVTGNKKLQDLHEVSSKLHLVKSGSTKRQSSTLVSESATTTKLTSPPESKKLKSLHPSTNMIELEIGSSDDEFDFVLRR